MYKVILIVKSNVLLKLKQHRFYYKLTSPSLTRNHARATYMTSIPIL